MAVVFFIYCMCVIRPTFECIHIVDIKQSRLCLSVTNIIHTFTHTGESGTDGIAAITIINHVQTLKAYIMYRLWYKWVLWCPVLTGYMSDRYGSTHKFSEQSDRTLELSLHRIEWKHWSSVSTFILYVFWIYIFSRFYILTDRLDSYVNCTDTEVVDICYC